MLASEVGIDVKTWGSIRNLWCGSCVFGQSRNCPRVHVCEWHGNRSGHDRIFASHLAAPRSRECKGRKHWSRWGKPRRRRRCSVRECAWCVERGIRSNEGLRGSQCLMADFVDVAGRALVQRLSLWHRGVCYSTIRERVERDVGRELSTSVPRGCRMVGRW